MKHIKTILVIALAFFAMTTTARANSLTWMASTANNDSYGQFPGGHAFVFSPGAPGVTYIFDGAGTFTENDVDNNGTFDNALLSGTLKNISNVNDRWTVNISFSAVPTVQIYSPKEELKPAAYDFNGGPVDPDSWRFYNWGPGSTTLTGLGSNVGSTIMLSQRPSDLTAPFQVGVGANGKNANMGASGWFSYLKKTPQGDVWVKTYGTGDINIDLTPTVPEPATMFMFGSGLMGAMLRLRQKTA
jgi:hypothetical protein